MRKLRLKGVTCLFEGIPESDSWAPEWVSVHWACCIGPALGNCQGRGNEHPEALAGAVPGARHFHFVSFSFHNHPEPTVRFLILQMWKVRITEV